MAQECRFVKVGDLDSSALMELIGTSASERLQSEIELLDHAGHSFDRARVLNGDQTPVFFDFSAFVFKIQANMDPRHRDRIAFLRIVSGRFEAGMEVNHVRTGKKIRLASPQTFIARDRTAVDEAWAGRAT